MLQAVSTELLGLLRDWVPWFRPDARVITGYYNIAGRRKVRTNQHEFFACRAEHFTAYGMSLVAPVVGNVGDPIIARFEQFGRLKGSIAKVSDRGFDLTVEATDAERATLAAKIDWFKKHWRDEVVDKRQAGRQLPREPLSTLTFADGRTARCFVVDMSSTGAAVSAAVAPEIGTPLAVGKIVGRVVRHTMAGFSVRFVSPQDPDGLERLLIKPALISWSDGKLSTPRVQ
jgi:hypothetical protein